MPIAIEAILQIEEALSKRLSKSLSKLLAALLKDVLDSVSGQRWEDAIAKVNRFDVTPVYDLNEKFIRASGLAAMIFGATRLTSDKDAVSIGSEASTELLDKSLTLLRLFITKSVTEATTKQLMADIITARDVMIQGTVYKAARLIQPFQSFADDADNSLKVTSQLHTSRLSALGFTAEAEVLEVTTYRINEQLDTHICPVCAEMHGKTFPVQAAQTSLNVVLNTTNPDELTRLQPWPKQTKDEVARLKAMDSATLIANNWHFPPFHPGCRGLLVAETSVLPPVKVEERNLDTFLDSPEFDKVFKTLGNESYRIRGEYDVQTMDLEKGFLGLHAAREYMGFNKLPKLINKRDLDANILGGKNIELVRGVTSSREAVASERIGQLKTGEHYAGLGVYGNGTYTLSSIRVQTHIDKILGDEALSSEVKLARVNFRKELEQETVKEIIGSYANNDLTGVARMGVNTNIKIIEKSDLLDVYSKEFKELIDNINGLTLKITEAKLNDDIELESALKNQIRMLEAKKYKIKAIKETDLSMYATLRGYDAVEIESSSYLVVLNRSILNIQKEAVAQEDFIFGVAP